jgi:hypothetical protein
METSGRFFRKKVEKPIPAIYTDAAVRQRPWRERATRVGLTA